MSKDQLQRIQDELEIRNVIASLAHLADNDGDDLTDYLSLIAEDGTWEMAADNGKVAKMKVQGHAALKAAAITRRREGIQGPESASLHTVTTTAVKLNGDRATAKSYFIYLNDTDTVAKVARAGSYNDEFRRSAGGWKLFRRVITQR